MCRLVQRSTRLLTNQRSSKLRGCRLILMDRINGKGVVVRGRNDILAAA